MRLASVRDENLKALESQSRVQVRVRGNEITIVGVPGRVQTAIRVITGLYQVALTGRDIEPDQVKQAVIQA